MTDKYNILEFPGVLPVFPLEGVLLLPNGRLPLNIFEPRYINMINDTLASDSRMIVMTQPKQKAGIVYNIGCAGKIISFEETLDKRYLITLEGIIRCELIEELSEKNGYRRMKVDLKQFSDDLNKSSESIERVKFMNVLKKYFKSKKISADWNIIDSMNDSDLVTNLAMICPFSNEEKQALLEAKSIKTRVNLMITMLEIGSFEENKFNEKKH